ncbi:hypothetical protein Sjap_015867 [Stephania japonica]|uniref:Uncharacterized protein n=1 Tax=Stephania japonica TaxID=461633 RepID=A0AAP0NT80_9MAGN
MGFGFAVSRSLDFPNSVRRRKERFLCVLSRRHSHIHKPKTSPVSAAETSRCFDHHGVRHGGAK